MYDGISLCTGILGFELGMAITGLHRFINIRECVEINPYCQDIIRQRLPGTPIYPDLKSYNPTGYDGDKTIIWSGFPCQPVSGAGKQRGDKDDRYLWSEILRLIRKIRPAIWLGENVDGLRTAQSGRLFTSILRELSESGYCVEWSCVSAAEVGAVHQRERIWIIAYPNSERERQQAIEANTSRIRRQARLGIEERDCWHRSGNLPNVAHTKCSATAMEKLKSGGQRRQSTNSPESEILRQEYGAISSEGNSTGDLLPTHTESWSPEQQNQRDRLSYSGTDVALIGGSAESANTSSQGHQGYEWERISGEGWKSEPSNGTSDKLNQDAQPLLRRSDDGLSADLDRYLLRHPRLTDWLTTSTIPTFTRLSSAEVGSLSPEDQAEYRQLLKEYQSVKREYERWLEALGNAICPQQSAIAWRRVGQILGLPTVSI